MFEQFVWLLVCLVNVDALNWDSCTKSSCSEGVKSITTSICNVDRRGKISQTEFLEKYAFTKPVILTGVSDNAEFQKLCENERLLKDHGNKVVTLSTANTHSYEKFQMTFADYMEKVFAHQEYNKTGPDTLYWFGNHDYAEWDSLFKHYKTPPYELPGKTIALSFGVAGPGTGVPFHFHGPGFSEVIHGSKRWFLLPFEQKPDFDPNKTTLRWLLEDYVHLDESEKPFECVIKPGEVLYFPDKWWHATLNIEESVFISSFLG
uniref:Bifunctional arginine demethylase and lysyl-hydroxylase JMJD6-A n=1 Tax=Phallusia mammillata TaxID=59560 RepID=A0A6F9DGD3_9ASCI|nr:bifunctional arginine demethylase and lysyl-hydroxylase JMJD6-A [Phallusia mammillata]